MSKALGSDFAGRGHRREDGHSRATLEDMGEVFALRKGGRRNAFENWTWRRKTGKGIGLINSNFLI